MRKSTILSEDCLNWSLMTFRWPRSKPNGLRVSWTRSTASAEDPRTSLRVSDVLALNPSLQGISVFPAERWKNPRLGFGSKSTSDPHGNHTGNEFSDTAQLDDAGASQGRKTGGEGKGYGHSIGEANDGIGNHARGWAKAGEGSPSSSNPRFTVAWRVRTGWCLPARGWLGLKIAARQRCCSDTAAIPTFLAEGASVAIVGFGWRGDDASTGWLAICEQVLEQNDTHGEDGSVGQGIEFADG